MDTDRVPTILGFAGALVVLAALVFVVGVADIREAFAAADARIVALVVLAAALWLVAWGLALQRVLRALGAHVPVHTAALVVTAAVFANNVTPFGQAGGEPVSALIISQAADADYETGLAAIASLDTLHFLPTIGYGAIGLVLIAAGSTPFGRNLTVAAVAIGGLAVGVVVAALVGWRYRYQLEAAVVRVITPVVRLLGKVVPGKRVPTPESIETRIERFFHAIDRVADDRPALVEALALSALGWLLLMVALWLSVYSLGPAVPFGAIMLVIPVSKIAGFTPLPGGAGAIEWVLAGLLGPTAGVSTALATTAVLIHRGATYWLPILVGGGVASALGADKGRERIGD